VSAWERPGFCAPPPGSAPPAPADLEIRDISIEGIGRRFVLLVPRHLAKDERVPLLILLHGLGETGDPRMGAYAWLERYGLGTAYDRLRRPPVQRTSKRADWTDERVREVNAALAARPFRGFCIACPYTLNVNKSPSPARTLDEYAGWIADVVIPRVRREAPVIPDTAHTAIDGCSLGGYVGLEVFLRRPDLFASWGGVQSAFGAHRAAGYADRIEKALASQAPRSIRLHLETSSGDPFREGNALLSSLLTKKGIANELRILPGPHDQPWLRESGTLEMLLWHDRMRP
jgi:pimeloyl-ACP methyl ester carboxylesterase